MTSTLAAASALSLAACAGEVVVEDDDLPGTSATVDDNDGSYGDDGSDSPFEPAADGVCSPVGVWDGVSPAYSIVPETRAAYNFGGDGAWRGDDDGSNPGSDAFMSGTFTIVDGVLSLKGAGMTLPGWGFVCDPGAEATYAATFSADCKELHLVTLTDGCTGGRHYLSASSAGSKLVRR